MTSLSDLSKLSGYSKATISRALSGNGYVSKETRKIILDLAKELDYTPNTIAQDLSAVQQKISELSSPTSSIRFLGKY